MPGRQLVHVSEELHHREVTAPDTDATGPLIRYARSADGINLAYWSSGSGPPLVFMPTLVSNIESDWHGERGKVYKRFAENHQLIRYDGRGHGMSDRRPEDLSLDALVDDLKTVADDLDLERFAIFAPTVSATTAIAFAAQHPQRVTHLVLWHAFPSYSEYFQSSIGDALSLVKDNWDLFTLTAAHVRVGWLRPTEARQAANLLRDSVERDFYLREIDGASELDATAFLQDVAAPTLVLCRRQFNDYELETSKRLAASIPGAKLALVSGAFNRIYDEKEEAIQQVEEFLGVSHCRPVRLQETATGQLNDLTRREIEILRYLAEGWRNREIAAKLGLSVYTVSRHVATIYQKIGAHGRAEATRYAIGFGLIPVEDPAI